MPGVPCVTLRAEHRVGRDGAGAAGTRSSTSTPTRRSPRWSARRRRSARSSTATGAPPSALREAIDELVQADTRGGGMSGDAARRAPVRGGGRARLLGPQPGPQLRRAPRLRADAGCCDAVGAGARALVAARSRARAPPASSSELLADPELDAVVLATPVPTHAELAVARARGRQALLRGEAAGASRSPTPSAVVAAASEARPDADGRAPARVPPGRRAAQGARSTSGELGDIYYIYGEPPEPGQAARRRERALEPRRPRRVGRCCTWHRRGAGRVRRLRRVLRARRRRGRRLLLPALPLGRWPRTCTCPGSTRTRSGASPSSARSGWRPSTTWPSSASSRSTTRASTRTTPPTASTSPARATSGRRSVPNRGAAAHRVRALPRVRSRDGGEPRSDGDSGAAGRARARGAAALTREELPCCARLSGPLGCS